MIELRKIEAALHRISICCLISLFAVLTLLGCGGSSQSSNPPPPLKGQLYVVKPAPEKVLRFKMGDSGDVSPQAFGDLRSLGTPIGYAAIDVTNDRLAAASSATTSPGSVTLFDHVSTDFCPAGCSSLTRLISGPATTLNLVGTPPALDGKHDLLYVLAFPGGGSSANIAVFGPASTITGNVPPLRILTTTFVVGEIVLDGDNDRLFAADTTNHAVAVFDNASTLSGAVVPNRVITGPATQISFPLHLAVNTTANVLVVDDGPRSAGVTRILVFSNPGTANGNVAPMASSTLVDQPQQPEQLGVSPKGELYVVGGVAAGVGAFVAVYTNITAANGNLAATRTILGPHTQLDDFAVPSVILGVALDPTR